MVLSNFLNGKLFTFSGPESKIYADKNDDNE